MSVLTTLTGSKVALGLTVAGVISVGGAGVAAYAGVLRGAVQSAAPDLIGAPSPSDDPSDGPVASPSAEPSDSPLDSPSARSSASPSSAPQGPGATGPAAFGLCNAFAHGGLGLSSTAYWSLAKAAGGVSGIGAYCATVAHPGKSGAHHPDHTGRPLVPGKGFSTMPPSHGANGHSHKSAHTHP